MILTAGSSVPPATQAEQIAGWYWQGVQRATRGLVQVRPSGNWLGGHWLLL